MLKWEMFTSMEKFFNFLKNFLRGRVVLIVNVASECGFTKTNYPQMKVLLEKYKDKGLSVACFPCNQVWFIV